MKPVYGDIALAPGSHKGGIVSILVIPKEFVTANPVIDFATGIVTTALTLAAGAAWRQLIFTPYSYNFDESPKSSRPGSFFETTVKGTVNNLTPQLQQLLNTLRHHELMAQVIDREKNIKLAGNTERGMILQFNPTNTNAGGGVKTLPVTLTIQTEDPTPFYIV